MRNHIAAVGLVAVLVMAATGCGGSHETVSKTDTSPPSTASQTASSQSQGGTTTTPARKATKDPIAEYGAIAREIYQIGDAYGRATRDSATWSGAVTSKYFGDLAGSTRTVARQLNRATPANAATAMKDRAAVVAGLNRLARDIDRVSGGIKSKDNSATHAAASTVASDAAQLNARLNAMLSAVAK